MDNVPILTEQQSKDTEEHHEIPLVQPAISGGATHVVFQKNPVVLGIGIVILITGVLITVVLTKATSPGPMVGSRVVDSTPTVASQPIQQGDLGAVLDDRIQTLQNTLATNPVIVSALVQSSIDHEALSESQIQELDATWKATEGIDNTIKSYLTNDVARVLFEYQEHNVGYPEIFVTDIYGLNVGQTNKTSDYYQADEDWWKQAYSDGVGYSYHGEMEFDESAQSESIALYVPVYDNTKVIGVIKAVVDVASLEVDL